MNNNFDKIPTHKPGIILRIVSFFTKRPVVCLKGILGELYWTLAFKSSFAELCCYVHPLTKKGLCKLEEDGTVKDSYIKRWKFYK